jgi:SsrA-binding protein
VTTIAQNRRARHDYHVVETLDAGIALTGTEVKSCRQHDVSLADTYAAVRENELWLYGAHIAPYSHGNRANHDPRRTRKLLVHRNELRRLQRATQAEGMTLVPLRFFFSRGHVKVELGLCKGKQTHDKRETLRRKEHERDMRRALRQR